MSDVAPEGRQVFSETNAGRPKKKRHRPVRLPDRYALLVDGVITVDDLDDEEIFRGQLRAADGTFRGSPPRAIPWVLHDALRASMTRRTERRLAEAMPRVTESLIGIANNTALNPQARVQAITLIMDRAMGKVPEKQETQVTITSKWEEAVQGGRVVVDLDDEEDEDIVEAEVVPDVEVVVPEIEARPVTRAKTGVRL